MRMNLLIVSAAMIFLLAAALPLRADEVDMQNGDRYFGAVLSVSADTVVLQSDVLGKINVPRKKVASLTFGAKAAPPQTTGSAAQISAPTNPPIAHLPAFPVITNLNLSAAFRGLGASTNFIGQIRRQFLADNPAAASNYDAMVSGLLNGTLDMDDLRRQAQSAADQLREMKHDLGPDAAGYVDAYLGVLDNFLKESAGGPTNAVPAPSSKPQTP